MSIHARFQLDWPGFQLDVDMDLPSRGITALFGVSGSENHSAALHRGAGASPWGALSDGW